MNNNIIVPYKIKRFLKQEEFKSISLTDYFLLEFNNIVKDSYYFDLDKEFYKSFCNSSSVTPPEILNTLDHAFERHVFFLVTILNTFFFHYKFLTIAASNPESPLGSRILDLNKNTLQTKSLGFFLLFFFEKLIALEELLSKDRDTSTIICYATGERLISNIRKKFCMILFTLSITPEQCFLEINVVKQFFQKTQAMNDLYKIQVKYGKKDKNQTLTNIINNAQKLKINVFLAELLLRSDRLILYIRNEHKKLS